MWVMISPGGEDLGEGERSSNIFTVPKNWF